MTGQQFTDYIAKNCPRLLADFVVIADSFEQYSYQKFNREDSKQALNHHLSKLKYHYRRLRWQLWLAKLGIQ